VTLLIVAVAFGTVGLLYASWYRSDEQRVRRTLRGTSKSSIAELPEGKPGRIVGRVAPGATIEAPLSGRRCVYFEVTVHEDPGGDDAVRLFAHEAAGVPFVIEDGSGRALIDPRHVRLALTIDRRTESGTFDDATAREEAFLRRRGTKSTGMVFNRTLTYREAVIEIGETVAVVGVGVREPDLDAGAGAGYRDGPPTRLRMNGSPRHPLLISDQRDTQQP
jgi:hypothetical protein